MVRALYYPPADRTSQWYGGGTYGGSTMDVDQATLHTTEGPGGWPGYSGGAVAPGLTMLPIMAEKRCVWRQHFKINESGRALENKTGGVQTNTVAGPQIELVGTSVKQSEASKVDAGWRAAFMSKRENVDYVFWGDPPDWALKGIADFMRFMRDEWGVPLVSPGLAWVPVTQTGDGQRMSFTQWTGFRGWCAHEHVPENSHRDAGPFPIARALALAGGSSITIPSEEDNPMADLSDADKQFFRDERAALLKGISEVLHSDGVAGAGDTTRGILQAQKDGVSMPVRIVADDTKP